MKRKFNKKVIAQFEKRLDGENFEVFVLDDGEYYNVHVISERFKSDELNTLKLQEPKEYVTLEYFSQAQLIAYLMEHFIWDRFYGELQEKDLQISCAVAA